MYEFRRYRWNDIDPMVDLLRKTLKEFHYNDRRFSPDKVRNLLRGQVTSKSFFGKLALSDGDIVGALVASVQEYPFSYEAYAQDYITLVVPEHRSLAVITTLVREYIFWAKSRGVVEIRWSQSSGYRMDKFPILAKRFGFVQIGTHFHMEVGK